MTHDAQRTITPLKISECNLKIICATPHHSLTICKVSASLNQNCRRSYSETNMLKKSYSRAVTLLKTLDRNIEKYA